MNTLDLNIDDRGVAYVALNRAEKRNALNSEMMTELQELALSLGQNPNVRVVVLSGHGKTFCAGGDLDWMKAQILADRPTRMREARRLAVMLKVLNEMPKPLIGKIHGAAMGGGVGMACVCDVAIAEDGTKFGLTETRLGLTPSTISPYVLARLGEGMARRVFMSSRIFDAAEAEKLGMISRAVSAQDIDAALEEEIAPYLTVAPGAVAAAKALARKLGPIIDDATIDMTIENLADVWEGPEALEGIQAFLSKTKPSWA